MGRLGHKFRAKPSVFDGQRFASKKEASRVIDLSLLKADGKVLFFLREVPMRLPGGTRYRVDYVVFWADGTVSFEDVKGVETPLYKVKKREIEAAYPVTIEQPEVKTRKSPKADWALLFGPTDREPKPPGA